MTASLRADATTPEENGYCKRLVQVQMVWPRSEGPIRTFEAVAAVQDVREGERRRFLEELGIGHRAWISRILARLTLGNNNTYPRTEKREKRDREYQERKKQPK